MHTFDDLAQKHPEVTQEWGYTLGRKFLEGFPSDPDCFNSYPDEVIHRVLIQGNVAYRIQQEVGIKKPAYNIHLTIHRPNELGVEAVLDILDAVKFDKPLERLTRNMWGANGKRTGNSFIYEDFLLVDKTESLLEIFERTPQDTPIPT